ncbi:MAG: alpha/beta fold hydrolase [Bacteroidota bacterium]
MKEKNNSSLPVLLLVITLLLQSAAHSQAKYPTPVEGDYIMKFFMFSDAQVKGLSPFKIHYTTVGKPQYDKNGDVMNAVLIMHGSTGSGKNFLTETFAGALFGPGQLLDATKYYIILPDAIGHGKSEKPSDGLHMRFPTYNYDDMVLADYRLLTEHLHVGHLRLVMGTSMGGMHTWIWGYRYPDFMDALMPLASIPTAIAGRNRIQRKMAIDLIKMDPEWKGGEYTQQPKVGLTGAISSMIYMTSSPLQWQKNAPTRKQAEDMLDNLRNRFLGALDANDFIYQFDASRDYDPSPHLAKIKAPLFAINSADDQVNPPELGLMEMLMPKVQKGRYILLPITDKTTGHGTHSNPAIWGQYLAELLKLSEPSK